MAVQRHRNRLEARGHVKYMSYISEGTKLLPRFLRQVEEYQRGTLIRFSYYILLQLRFLPNELQIVKATAGVPTRSSGGAREGLSSTAIQQCVVKRRLGQNLCPREALTSLFSCLKHMTCSNGLTGANSAGL